MRVLTLTMAVGATLLAPVQARADVAAAIESVVSVLPTWPNRPEGGPDVPPGAAPEGTGIALAIDDRMLIVTARHVIDPATRIRVRLGDGRIVEATLVGDDRPSDIALLSIEPDVAPITIASDVSLAEPVCAIGNAYGLNLSVTCGVVSALDVAHAGFNPIEDFLQTDAAANPGSSGGALVNAEGELVGMVSAIFASRADTNIGINFAISTDLLMRIATDLADDGRVTYAVPGWRLERLDLDELSERAGARLTELRPDGKAALAGLEEGDIITRIGTRAIESSRDAVSAVALFVEGETAPVTVVRDGETLTLDLKL